MLSRSAWDLPPGTRSKIGRPFTRLQTWTCTKTRSEGSLPAVAIEEAMFLCRSGCMVGQEGSGAGSSARSDLAAGDAFGHQAQNLLLSWGQALELRIHRSPLVEQGSDGARRDESSSAGHGADGIDHLGRRPGFMDERAGAGLQGREPRSVTVLTRQEDQLGLGPDLTDSRPGVRAGTVGEAEVQDYHVGAELGCEADRLSNRADVADH